MNALGDETHLATLVLYTRKLSALIDAGVSLMRSFAIIQDTTTDASLAAANGDISQRVGGGATLSEAMGSHPDLFSPFYIAFVRAGEIGGVLDESLAYLADWLEQERDAAERLQIRAAILRLTAKAQTARPDHTPETALEHARESARLASFCRLLEMCLTAGVPADLALATAAEVLPGPATVHLRAGADHVGPGRRIADLLAEVDELKAVVAPLAGIGEDQACLDHMLRKAAEFYDAQASDLLTSAIPLPR